MNPLQWAIDPWEKLVPIHIAWFLIWVAVIAGLLFFIVHATYVRYFAKPRQFAAEVPPPIASEIPARVPVHSLVARLYHWIAGAAMFTLLFTAFLPRVGFQFSWVTWHWIAGAVLTVLVIFHIFHASLWMDFWAIWPDRIDITDADHRIRRFLGGPAPPPRKSAKYPLDVKLSHGAFMAAGLTAIVTGVFMMSRVRTIFFPRNPYLFSDMTWGMIYVLHGLAGVGLIALVMVHVYFTLIRPEYRSALNAMIFGWMSRDSYLEEYDPKRWVVEATISSLESRGPKGLGAGNAE